jgi:hypothetical protein
MWDYTPCGNIADRVYIEKVNAKQDGATPAW